MLYLPSREPPPAADLSEEALRRRPDFPALSYWGMDHSLDVLAHVRLTWDDLNAAAEEFGKPIADLGASFSSLALEGRLRGVPVTALDISFDLNRRQYEHGVLVGLRPLIEYYREPGRFPPGFAPRNPIDQDALQEHALRAQARGVLNEGVLCDFCSIPLPDRHFALSLAHDSVPKHAPDLEVFLERQLPEILRVTDGEARLYPMSLFKTLNPGTLHEHLAEIVRLEQRIDEVAAVASSCGFSFELQRGQEWPRSGGSAVKRADSQVAVFTRRKVSR